MYDASMIYSFDLQVTCADVQDTDLFWMDTEHSAVKVMVGIVSVSKTIILEL